MDMKRGLQYGAVIVFLACSSVWGQTPDQDQVSVAVKIIEFQTTKGLETGLSAFFKRREQERAFGRVTSGNGNITAADITFPTSSDAGITVFLDRITNEFGNFEVVLQGLVDENRANILSRPKAMVPVGAETPTTIETVQKIPYEDTIVVGATIQQVTSFRDTGVMLDVQALEVIDDDGNRNTMDDTYMRLRLTARVNEEGQRITVALDDALSGSGDNAIRVPEFISRSITTEVWVRHGQVLLMGGLFRNSENRNVSTLPWLTQGEDIFNGLVQRISPFSAPDVPISSSVGNQGFTESRRELVFLIKSELWRPAYTVADQYGFEEPEDEEKERESPTDVITDVIEGITGIPKGVAEGIAGTKAQDELSESLGGDEE